MELIFQWLWLAYFAVAYTLWKGRRGNAPLIFGLAGMGTSNLYFTLTRWDWIQIDRETATLFQGLSLLSMGVLILGVFMIATGGGPLRGGTAHMATLLDASSQSLSTLFIPRNDTNTYSQGERARDAACERLAARAKEAGLEVIVQKSNAHSPTVWFRLDYLMPFLDSDPNLSLRAHVEVVVERYDFHRFQNLFTVSAKVGLQGKTISGVIAIDEDATERIHRFITQPGSRLRLPNRVRNFPWQLWRPRNKVTRLRRDWELILFTVLGAALMIIPIVGPLLGVILFIGLYFWNRRRRTYVLTSGRPMTDPRSLRWMDSWQATILGLGSASQNVSKAVMERLRTSAPTDLSVAVERVGYWGVDSRVERDQIAVRYRHALGIVQVTPHGDNLYAAWECHINIAAWSEQTLAQGVDKNTGLLVHANRVVSGFKFLNEYDVADANFLAEWLHEAVKRELKLKMAEQKIDQEVDFTVQRESRKQAIGAGQPREQTADSTLNRMKSGLNRFRRVA